MRSQRGATPLELALGIMLLLFPMAMLVLSLGPWMEHRLYVRTAAAEAARVLVLAEGETEAELLALDLISRTAANFGIDAQSVSVGFCGAAPAPLLSSGSGRCTPLQRGAMASVTVVSLVPAVVTPLAEVGGWTVEVSHTEAVDLYRSRP
jgi:Flp pilus assembly protein TadG